MLGEKSISFSHPEIEFITGDLNNIKSYAEFFNKEIPHCISYWENKND